MKNLFSIEKKVILITGGSKGIGHTIATGLSKNNAIIYAYSRSYKESKLNYNGQFYEYKGSIDDNNNFSRFCNLIFEKHNKIDGVINNAGITITNSDNEYSINDWNKTFNINVTAVFQNLNKVIPLMKKNKTGSIINITSIGATLSFPNNPAYIASKGALKMLTKSIANDFAKDGIRCNNIAPGYIKTDMTKKSYNNSIKRKKIEEQTILNRWGTPHELVGPCIFLLSDASSFITGQDIYVDGGWTSKGL